MSPSHGRHDTSLSAFLALVDGRRGHFQVESGHHGSMWLELDGLFADSARIAPFVAALAAALRAHDVEMICGPLLGGAFLAQQVAQVLRVPFCFTDRRMPSDATGLYPARYALPRVFHDRVRAKRIAIVDDVVSAGSALRGTLAELTSHGAVVAAAGALLQLGDTGAALLAAGGVRVEAVARDEYSLWLPEHCPLCDSKVPLERPASAA